MLAQLRERKKQVRGVGGPGEAQSWHHTSEVRPGYVKWVSDLWSVESVAWALVFAVTSQKIWGRRIPSRVGTAAAKASKRTKKSNSFMTKEVPTLIASEPWRSHLNSCPDLWLCIAIPGPSGCQHTRWSWAMLEAQNCPTIHWETLPRNQEAKASSSFYANKAKQ